MFRALVLGAALACASLNAFAGARGQGIVVRVAAGSVEPGWHQGRMVLDARKCWMVQLDRPTRHGYTMLALSFVDAAEIPSSTGWSPLALERVVRDQPTKCLEEGSD
jgi:hypothetical protein